MKNLKKLIATVVTLSVFSISCESELFGPKNDINNADSAKGSLSLSITDAPIDQSDVSAVFVTITEIKVDGKTFSGFKGPKTVNLLALQNGNTLELGKGDAAVDSYSTLTLVIDATKDEAQNAPGCYITKTNGTKQAIEISGNGATEIDLKPKNFTINENANTEIVMDFDLRKSIKSKNNGFAFVTLGELKSAVRAENKVATGTLKGKIENYSIAKSDVVVYVYKKGTFNSSKEINGQGSSEIKFANAITSAKTDGAGNFTLAYLPAGEYEVYCDKPDKNALGLGLNTLLNIKSNVDLKNVGVNAGAQTNLSLSISLGGILN